ncbi:MULTISPECIES: A/G-specific adenine glycosylase [Arthrobacter]|uniref:Adenine DNA glycosylase n=1 Tax=Arthrobacter caoxuetaonis TaxID=2886935 RepID=A0A9X1SDF6_9MICC|nr:MULTISPECIES: A/G-specific adenine glycosylase [Arthrobacter]MCC3281670.1 A/G-specific adenine glycosylase [Arthrobacter caoxuetaonis]MCC3298661.1 A/G-specific adenine glycosylase [Arthrobacter caoxuetaonis]MCC9194887.1 A/G-specific adenine glycosylase [Arthrobacter sp. zg-Y916]USQ57398.1 A/G-specific adenine glycosylase [Arthrobacter caoxuetaonis]
MEPEHKRKLHARINGWFAENARDLPWRDPECSPWGILVSEVMLQQTPVVRVLPVWHEWMERWPEPAALAAEPSGEAVRAWGRLGYPRRALRLHAAAAAITEVHGGKVPDTHAALLTLPGVGDYTAAAVASFAFGRRETVVDTNIRRVHARLITGNALPSQSLTAAEMRLADSLLPDADAEAVAWNASVMELGAMVCTARSPRCEECPVLSNCAWVQAGRPEPHYIPKGQAWHGTDRQVRGAMMAVLRQAEGPVLRELLLTGPVDLGAPAADSSLSPLGALHALSAPQEQLERALAGLLRDGLAELSDAGVRLPA